jgi:DNA-binding SARP family transcriptional activator
MEFRVLGPLRVLGPDGAEVRLASASQRRLMSLLVARAGSVVSADTLAAHLDLSAGALRTSVSRLRRVVGFDVLVTAPPGYELLTDEVDAIRFERLVGQARVQPDPGPARARLEAALALWRGDAYAEFAHEHWAMAEARRLNELRASAAEDLAELLIDRREWTAAIDRLHALIAAEPLRDRPYGLLMRALDGSGRQADALRVFQEHRAFLIEETGTAPSIDLVALEREIVGRPTAPPTVVPTPTMLTVLLTEVVAARRLRRRHGPALDPAVARHYEILDRAIADAGGSRPLEQGEGERSAGCFPVAAEALGAAIEAQRRLLAELPALPVRMALHSAPAVDRGGSCYSAGTIPQCARLRARGHGGQILASAATIHAAAGLADAVTFAEVGAVRLRASAAPEPVWQVVHPDLPRAFPPLPTADTLPTPIGG